MGIQVELHHRTAYRYDRAISLGPQIIQLRPAPHCRTPVTGYTLEVSPADHLMSWQFDPLANHLARVVFLKKTDEFVVDVRLTADMTPINAFAFLLEPGFEQYPFQYPPPLAQLLEPYRLTENAGDRLRGFLQGIPHEEQGTIAFLRRIAAKVRDEIGYVIRLEHGVQSCEYTLTERLGSCRDSAWLLVQVLRSFGFAARFVSGYLLQLAANEGSEGPRNDSVDLHAWAEVFLPGAGWIGLDPTSGLFAAEGHIPLVCTPSPSEAAPISGTVETAQVAFSHVMSVRRVNEPSSFSKPYGDSNWARVRDVAHAVDLDLRAQGVGLTMGGEPTFVGTEEPESPEWNLGALGAKKRSLALILLRQLREKVMPGGLLHYGQGKWYPGEPLPRWAFHCIARKDGLPIWEDISLIAEEDQATSYDLDHSLAFIQALARRLRVSTANILSAFERDNEKPTGFMLPLRRRQAGGALFWSSQLWFEHPERLDLFPGDSPIGYRITAETIPFIAPDELARDEHEMLPAHPARHPEWFATEAAPDSLPALPRRSHAAEELIRPTLCVQAVGGRLHVFLPYIPALADYVDLVAAVEDTCRHLAMPIWLEGYTAPHDPRLSVLGLTPDPGVLEVNLPPTTNWDELETISTVLHEVAHDNQLISTKFAYDGSHLPTGGGSHIVLGGATVPESPILRRPDLLRSMVTFWQRHPSLSYLFSGMYVGPTSQYPRVDEARVDALYELEVAFSQLGREPCSPRILDGLFRNLLVDVTGNTHRAEFCIDKLFPPEGQGLRLGLLELRAFEMPPHYQMGLVQYLLVRAFVASFWRAPYAEPLQRWGTALHDRFMLPYFVAQDFQRVLVFLRAAGFAFEDSWFETHFDFRFPKLGSVSAQGVELELRQALEPWNVLAEETTSGSTGRSVDSSLERLQIKVTGVTTGQRVIVSCNGRKVPLVSTGREGEAVAGIRYRARRLSAALHPTIPIHTPLVFDLIDTASARSIARCIYYSTPPDGDIPELRPRDAAEASERRLERFVISAAPTATISPLPDENNPVFPMTLDLRFPPAGTPSGQTS